MKQQYNSKELEQKVKELDPTLSDRSYEPDPSGHISRWVIKTFRSDRGFRVFNSLPYSMPQIPGGVVLGVCKPNSESTEMDITKEGYNNTLYHEHRHEKGDDEYLAEYHTESRNYSLAA